MGRRRASETSGRTPRDASSAWPESLPASACNTFSGRGRASGKGAACAVVRSGALRSSAALNASSRAYESIWMLIAGRSLDRADAVLHQIVLGLDVQVRRPLCGVHLVGTQRDELHVVDRPGLHVAHQVFESVKGMREALGVHTGMIVHGIGPVAVGEWLHWRGSFRRPVGHKALDTLTPTHRSL